MSTRKQSENWIVHALSDLSVPRDFIPIEVCGCANGFEMSVFGCAEKRRNGILVRRLGDENFTGQKRYLEADSRSSSQAASHLLWNLVHNSPPLISVLSQINPVHTFTPFYLAFRWPDSKPHVPSWVVPA